MSLILKTDTHYTGTVEARHLLSYLTTASSKTKFIKGMLEPIGADTAYVTDSTSPHIADKLLAHLSRIQSLEATVLSLPYTIKAIIFALSNSLTDDDFMAVSPDFGVKINQDRSVEYLYGLGNATLIPLPASDLRLFLDEFDGNNVVRDRNAEKLSGDMYSINALSIPNGLVMGQCLSQSTPTVGAGPSLRDASKVASKSGVTIQVRRRSTGTSDLLPYFPTTSFLASKSFRWDAPSKESLQSAGVVMLVDYGTINNKLLHNGNVVIDNTEGYPSFDMSSMSVLMGIDPEVEENGIVESWLINSKSTSLATALSNHLNRGG